MSERKKWVVDAVRYYRALGFFRNREDRGEVTGEEPGFSSVPIGLPLPAHARMTDEGVADLVLEHHRREWGREFDLAGEEAELAVVECDPFRVARLDTECVYPGDDAYVDVLHALARVSRGAFDPADVEESWEDEEEGPIRVSFSLLGRRHTLDLRVMGDWMDASLLAHVNELLAAASPCRLYAYDLEGQELLLVALAPDERGRLERERGWRLRDPVEETEGPDDAAIAAREAIAAATREGDDLLAAGQADAALERYGAALTVIHARLEEDPDAFAFCLLFEIHVQHRVGEILFERGAFAEAARAYERARLVDMHVESNFPEAAREDAVVALGTALRYKLVLSRCHTGEFDRALAVSSESVERLRRLRRDPRHRDDASVKLGLVHEQHGDLLVSLRQDEDGLAHYREAEACYTGLPPGLRETGDVRQALASVRQKSSR